MYRKLGAEVAVVEAQDRILPTYDAELTKPVAAALARLGVELHLGHKVLGLNGAGTAVRIQDASGAETALQMCIRDSAYAERNDEEQVPVIGLRRKIAQKMAESKRRIPHFSYVEEIDVTELEDLRVSLNAKFGESRGKLTLLPLLARAMVCLLYTSRCV